MSASRYKTVAAGMAFLLLLALAGPATVAVAEGEAPDGETATNTGDEKQAAPPDETSPTTLPPKTAPPTPATHATSAPRATPAPRAKAPSPEVFVPSEDISEDLSVRFPVDI